MKNIERIDYPRDQAFKVKESGLAEEERCEVFLQPYYPNSSHSRLNKIRGVQTDSGLACGMSSRQVSIPTAVASSFSS